MSCHVHDDNALLVERDRVDRVDVRLLVVRHLLAVALERHVPKHQRCTTRTRSHIRTATAKSNVKSETSRVAFAWPFPPSVAPFTRSVASLPPDRRGAQPTDQPNPKPQTPNPDPNPNPKPTKPQCDDGRALNAKLRDAFFGSTWWIATRPSIEPSAKPSRLFGARSAPRGERAAPQSRLTPSVAEEGAIHRSVPPRHPLDGRTSRFGKHATQRVW